jgi:peroxiredoxin Q/BCP
MGKEYDGIHRTTFVIDENGIEEVISDVKTKACCANSKVKFSSIKKKHV